MRSISYVVSGKMNGMKTISFSGKTLLLESFRLENTCIRFRNKKNCSFKVIRPSLPANIILDVCELVMPKSLKKPLPGFHKNV